MTAKNARRNVPAFELRSLLDRNVKAESCFNMWNMLLLRVCCLDIFGLNMLELMSILGLSKSKTKNITKPNKL